MVNQINSGSVDNLQAGQTILVHARSVANNKLQLEFAELLQGGNTPQNVLAMFNASDSRFSASKARRAWLTAEPKDAQQLLGISFVGLKPIVNDKGQHILPLNILNPMLNGQRLRVQIVESTDPTPWEQQNIATAAKRKGKDGEFITHQGKNIFTRATVVLGEPQNVFLTPDATTAAAPVVPMQAQPSAADVMSQFFGTGQTVNPFTGEILS